jgi:hypothetical protein
MFFPFRFLLFTTVMERLSIIGYYHLIPSFKPTFLEISSVHSFYSILVFVTSLLVVPLGWDIMSLYLVSLGMIINCCLGITFWKDACGRPL